jgi:hypothetical protein
MDKQQHLQLLWAVLWLTLLRDATTGTHYHDMVARNPA